MLWLTSKNCQNWHRFKRSFPFFPKEQLAAWALKSVFRDKMSEKYAENFEGVKTKPEVMYRF